MRRFALLWGEREQPRAAQILRRCCERASTMMAVYAILIFLAAIFLLNLIEFRRLD